MASELEAGLAALLEEHGRYHAVLSAAHEASSDAHRRLKDAYRNVIQAADFPVSQLADLDLQQLEDAPALDTLLEAETRAWHAPASPLNFGWNRTLERELRDRVQRNLDIPAQRFAQVQRMCGRLGERSVPEKPRELQIEPIGTTGFDVCPLCARDHWQMAGGELVLDGTQSVVCWLCGDEHSPAQAAQVLAKAVDEAEQRIATHYPVYFEHWIELLRQLGADEAAESIDVRCRRYQQDVRRAKEKGLADPAAWLQPRR